MFKTKVSLERIINEKHFQFICPSEASYQECLDIIKSIEEELQERLNAIVSEMKKSQEESELANEQCTELDQS